MKSIGIVLFVIVNHFLLAGCWDRVEVNDIAIVTAIGIDKKGPHAIQLSAMIKIPRNLGGGSQGGSSGGGGGSPTFVRTGEGNTLADAISNLQEKVPRQIFWGHIEMIVIGEKVAKEGIREPLDFVARHPQSRLRAFVFISKGAAKDVISLHPPLERSPAEVLRELANSEILMHITLKDLLEMLTGDAQAAAVPMVRIESPEKGQDPLQTDPYIDQTAILKEDRMVGQISDTLTRGLLWIRDEIREANVTIKPKEGKGYISCTMLRANTELIPRIENGKWKMTIKSVTEDDVIVNKSNLNLMNPKIIQELEKELEKDIEKRLTQTLEKLQKEMKLDVFGFAESFHREYPKEWQKAQNDWDKIYPSVEVTFDIKASILRPGLSTAPQGLPKDEVKQR